MLRFLLISFLLLSLSGCETAEEKSVRICEDGATAYPHIKELISERLVAPASASYPDFSNVRHRYLGSCRHRFNGYVDAQNRASAMLRLNYTIVVRANPSTGRYSVESFDMQQR